NQMDHQHDSGPIFIRAQTSRAVHGQPADCAAARSLGPTGAPICQRRLESTANPRAAAAAIPSTWASRGQTMMTATFLAELEARLHKDIGGNRRRRKRPTQAPRAAPKQLARDKPADHATMKVPLVHGLIGLVVAYIYFTAQIAWALHYLAR